MTADLRLTPARGGRTSLMLEGLAKAQTFVAPRHMTAVGAAAAIRNAPHPAAEQVDQLLFGEVLEVLDEADGFAWGQARRDGYVGFADLSELTAARAPPTHSVRAIRTHGFSEPDIKSRPAGLYSINSLLCVVDREGRFVRAAGSGWFVETQLAPIGRFADEMAGVAELFMGAPYLWGGRESVGLDCSGLVQQALLACGRACPRDADQQLGVGSAIDPLDLRRGDLVFWRGHVAVMLDHARIIHANAHHMAVAIEPLAEALTRIAGAGDGEPIAYRRP